MTTTPVFHWDLIDKYFRTNRVMAVKRIRSTVDEKEQKQLLMDLEVVMKSNDCVYIVQFYGALFKEVMPSLRGPNEPARVLFINTDIMY